MNDNERQRPLQPAPKVILRSHWQVQQQAKRRSGETDSNLQMLKPATRSSGKPFGAELVKMKVLKKMFELKLRLLFSTRLILGLMAYLKKQFFRTRSR